MYIHLHKQWPAFYWNENEVLTQLLGVKSLQAKLMGKIELLGFNLKNEANLEILIEDVVKSSEIEGEIINPEMVRSSIAIKLGLQQQGIAHSDRHIDGVVAMMIDATQNSNKLLTNERLFGWHAALFPTGRSGMYKIDVAQWRQDAKGPMQVVSGKTEKEIVHFEAPAANRLPKEMNDFIQWFNTNNTIDDIIKAAIAHLWFITIHPFDDGNGRIARAITDMELSKADGINQRFYSMSSQINKDKKAYYTVLEQTQKVSLDISIWLKWFLNCLEQAIHLSKTIIDKIIVKHLFWANNSAKISNDRQVKIMNKLLDGFEGNLTTSKWAKITKTSTDTALRDINDLIEKGILNKATDGGRSTHYTLVS
jgi:Fic family protein